MLRHSLLITMCALAVAGCVDEEPAQPERQPGIDRDGRRDLIGLDADISGKREGNAYEAYAVLRKRRLSGAAFAGYGCMTDCKDIEAGFRAAAAKHIALPRACTGATWGEVEGCVAYTQGLLPARMKLEPLEP